MKNCLILLLLVSGILSCNKETKYSNIPKITFQSVSDTLIKAATEKPVFIKFEFEDGDGNIGFGTNNLYLIDSRFINDTQRYEIPTIPDKFDPSNGLKGIIQLETNAAFLTLRNDSIHKKTDTLFWFLYMKDKADNMSNIIKTSTIVLKDSL